MRFPAPPANFCNPKFETNEVNARHKRHVKDFNLKHPFSWRTLREEELRLDDSTSYDS